MILEFSNGNDILLIITHGKLDRDRVLEFSLCKAIAFENSVHVKAIAFLEFSLCKAIAFLEFSLCKGDRVLEFRFRKAIAFETILKVNKSKKISFLFQLNNNNWDSETYLTGLESFLILPSFVARFNQLRINVNGISKSSANSLSVRSLPDKLSIIYGTII